MVKVGEWADTMRAERAFWEAWAYRTSLVRPAFWQYKLWVIQGVLMYHFRPIIDKSKLLEIGPGAVPAICGFPRGELYVCEPLWDYFESLALMTGIRKDVTCLCGKGEDLPLDSGPFDLVLALNSLDHCDDPNKVVENISKTIHGYGLFFEATTVWAPGKVNLHAYGKGHPHYFEGSTLTEMIEGHGFVLLERPLDRMDIDRVWADALGFTEQSWPCYLRVWRPT